MRNSSSCCQQGINTVQNTLSVCTETSYFLQKTHLNSSKVNILHAGFPHICQQHIYGSMLEIIKDYLSVWNMKIIQPLYSGVSLNSPFFSIKHLKDL